MLNVSAGRRDLVVAVAGGLVSAFGDAVALVALTLRLQADGARPYEVALLLAAGTLPRVLLSRPVGRLVDSHDSRGLLLASGAASVACTAPLVVLHSPAMIVVLVTLLGAATSVGNTTWTALIPRIVGEEQVAATVSTLGSLEALVLVGAPAVGGLLASAFGTGVPLALDVASFVVLTVAAALVTTRRRPPVVAADGPSSPAGAGARLLRGDGVLVLLTVGVALVVLLVGMVDVVLVFLVRATLHATGLWFGVAEAAWMAGMVVGSLSAGRIATEDARVWATIGGIGVACAALVPFAVVPAVWMLVPLSILGGAGNGAASVCFSTLMLARTPDAQRGRVTAMVNAVLGGAQGLSLLAGGAVAVALGPRAIYAGAGALGVGLTVVLALVHGTRASMVASDESG